MLAVIFPSHSAEAFDEWQVVKETNVDPRIVDPLITIPADKQHVGRAIQQLRTGKTVPTLNLNQSLGAEQMAL